MKCPSAFNGLMSTAALLMPMMAAPESHVQTAAASTATNAAAHVAAHVNFKIVIPTVLYLRMASADDGGGGAKTMIIMSNGRNVMLNPTARSPDDAHAHDGVILSAAAGMIIAQDAPCALGIDDAAAATARAHRVNFNIQPLVCTVSMP
jgi:hypothetical protein